MAPILYFIITTGLIPNPFFWFHFERSSVSFTNKDMWIFFSLKQINNKFWEQTYNSKKQINKLENTTQTPSHQQTVSTSCFLVCFKTWAQLQWLNTTFEQFMGWEVALHTWTTDLVTTVAWQWRLIISTWN